MAARRFAIQRDHDATGVSGTGMVAEGVVFSNGRVALQWCVGGKPNSLTTYQTVEDLLTIHNHVGTVHEGGTYIVFIDE